MPLHSDELSVLQAQIIYKKRLESVMRELTAQEASLSHKTEQLQQIMLHEQKDVDRLEKQSLSTLLYQFTGQRDSMLDKERREVYAARAKYETALRELDAIREDIRETQEDLKDLEDCEARYQAKLEEKRQEIEASSSEAGALLLDKEQLYRYLSQQTRELEEAITAGTSALRTMANLQQSLHSAKDWSVKESRTPAFWADHARKEKLDEAQENLGLLQVQMQKFNKELSDVTIRPNLQPSIQRMLSFADSLFDDVMADSTIPERIHQACALADQTRECILSVLRQLQNALEEVRHNHKRTQREMDEIVLQTIKESSEEKP